MIMIAVDDEINILKDMRRTLESIEGVEVAGAFTSSLDALKFVHKNRIDAAVLDINMPELTGIELAEMMKGILPDIQIIFVTGYDEYALSAYHLNALSYLMKPFTKDEVQEAVERAGHLLNGMRGQKVDDGLEIRCFGKFDIIVEGSPLFFKYSKAKELFALLVDARGGMVSMEQAITQLWENRTYDQQVKQLYRKAASIMRSTLREAGYEEICYYYRSYLALNMKKINCDYFDFMKGDIYARRKFMDNYMPEYSWAEETNAILRNIL